MWQLLPILLPALIGIAVVVYPLYRLRLFFLDAASAAEEEQRQAADRRGDDAFEV